MSCWADDRSIRHKIYHEFYRHHMKPKIKNEKASSTVTLSAKPAPMREGGFNDQELRNQ
jgi:hypothetical protein